MNILVTGGAGYIGSIATKRLIEEGHNVVVIDNLSKGLQKLVHPSAIFHKGDLTDHLFVRQIFQQYPFDLVMHFAAYKAAGESMENPIKYSNNIAGIINLLEEMITHKTLKIIFSSTAAVYGDPQYLPMDEQHPTVPANYYGFTKLKAEEIILWYSKIYNLRHLIFRYFNVAGDGGLKYVDPEANNIFPILMEVLSGKREKLTVFGNDYDTPDGTCIRDYIDVNDLVKAHILGLNKVNNTIINIGTGKGYSVLELVHATEKVLGKKLPYIIGNRRSGDPAKLYATHEKAKELLGWTPEKTLENMIASNWEGYKI